MLDSKSLARGFETCMAYICSNYFLSLRVIRLKAVKYAIFKDKTSDLLLSFLLPCYTTKVLYEGQDTAGRWSIVHFQIDSVQYNTSANIRLVLKPTRDGRLLISAFDRFTIVDKPCRLIGLLNC